KEQGRMLNSLLNRSQEKLVVDRFFKKEKGIRTLVTGQEAVLKETKKHYENQIHNRSPKAIRTESIWSEVYKLIEQIQDSWFQNIMSEVTEEEWNLKKAAERSIIFGNERIAEEKVHNIKRMLGIWLNSRLNEKQVFNKAREN
ncbi:17614_t:CDS:2, partial [Gigaspora margarita]